MDKGGKVIHWENENNLIAQVDELDYMKKALSTLDDTNMSVKTFVKLDRIGNIFTNSNEPSERTTVVKALKTNDTVDAFENSLKICELTKQAMIEDVGVKYFTHVILYDKNIPKRIYLYTEYLPIITQDFDEDKIEQFAEKISKTSLLFHPDFHYKNICIDGDGKLKAIDWDPEMATVKLKYCMMNRYKKNYYNNKKGGKKISKTRRKSRRKKRRRKKRTKRRRRR